MLKLYYYPQSWQLVEQLMLEKRLWKHVNMCVEHTNSPTTFVILFFFRKWRDLSSCAWRGVQTLSHIRQTIHSICHIWFPNSNPLRRLIHSSSMNYLEYTFMWIFTFVCVFAEHSTKVSMWPVAKEFAAYYETRASSSLFSRRTITCRVNIHKHIYCVYMLSRNVLV